MFLDGLSGSKGEDAVIAAAAEKAAATVDPSGDVHGSADYRRRMVKVFVTRALKEAWAKVA